MLSRTVSFSPVRMKGEKVYPDMHDEFFDILLTVHLNIFILILTNLMH